MKRVLTSSAGVNLRAVLIAFCAGSLSVIAVPAHAQVITDGSLGSQTSIAGPTYLINSALGQQRGSNLFHSFSAFNIGAQQTAQFNSNVGTTNIIARITGGSPSQINGAVNANANLFLMNPQGVVFGSNAILNVSGAFHATTADYIRFSDDTRFYANIGAASLLTTASPVVFGFLDSSVAPITANNAILRGADQQTLSLIGGDITLTNSQLSDSQGRVNLASVASAGEISLGTASLDANGFGAKGNIRLNHSGINANGEDAASIYIRGGQFVMENTSSMVGFTSASTGPRVIDIDVNSMQLNTSIIDFEPRMAVPGPVTTGFIKTKQLDVANTSVIFVAGGGDLSIATDDLRVAGSSVVGTGTIGAAGRAGNLQIQATTVTTDGGALTALSSGDGNAGGIGIAADTVNFRNGGGVISTTSGAGTGGQVSIKARQMVVDGTQGGTSTTGIAVSSIGTNSNAGAAGRVSIDVDSLTLRKAFVTSSTNGPGRGGDVTVVARTVSMEQDTAITTETGIVNQNSGVPATFGAGGAIKIDATSMQLYSGSRVSASTFSNGAGGTVTLIANQLIIDSAGSAVSTAITGITANTGSVSIDTAGGAGGNLTLHVSDLQLRNRGLISSNAYGTGAAGRIDIASDSASIDGGTISASSFGQMANAGGANDIVIQATNLKVANSGQITNSTNGAGAAGRLSISSQNLAVSSGGSLQASSLSNASNPGKAGDISISSDVVALSGGSVNARSFGVANPGGITMNARLFTLDNGAVVAATSEGNGNAGNIGIGVTDSLTLANASRITTEAVNGSGGDIRLSVGNRLRISHSAISTSVRGAASNGGNIYIDPIFTILDGGQIIARAVGGNGGNIYLSTQYLIQSVDSTIDASSQLGINGLVDIVAVDADLNADIVPLPMNFLNVKQWLATACAARQGSGVSQFVVKGRDGAYRTPSDLLVSPMQFDTAPADNRGGSAFIGTPLAGPLQLSFSPLCIQSGG